MRSCVLCEAPLVGEARSLEHVIPASLGGKRRTSKALCRQCNSTTGHEWDAELEGQLRPASLLVFPPDHSCGRKQRRIADVQGNRLLLKAGIRGGAEDPQVRIMTEAGSVGGPVAWNSMLKSMVTAGLLGGLTWLDMLTVVQLLRGSGPGGPCLMFRDSPVCPLGEVAIPVWRHCVHVETDMEEKLVWGYVEYFGTWCAIARLGKCYLGQPTQWTYCVDPVTGDDLTEAVDVDLTAAKGLINEMCVAPARSRDIATEQLPDPQPLVDECVRTHGVDGKIAITGTSYSEEIPYGGATIKEMTWIDANSDVESAV